MILAEQCDNQYHEGHLIDNNITFNGQHLDTLIADELIDLEENRQYWNQHNQATWLDEMADVIVIEQHIERKYTMSAVTKSIICYNKHEKKHSGRFARNSRSRTHNKR